MVMIREISRYSLYFLLSLSLVSFTSLAQRRQVSAKLEQETIRIGDQTKLSLTVDQQAGERIRFPAFTDTLAGKIQVVSVGKTDTIADPADKHRVTVLQNILITSFDPGTYTIPALTFGTPDGNLQSSPLTLYVQTVKVDTTKAIFDIKKPMAVSYTFVDWLKDNWIWMLAVLGVIVLTAGFYFYWKKRSRRKPLPRITAPPVPVHQMTLLKLEKLKEKRLWQQNEVKQYYSELSEVIREYLEKRYQIRAMENTTAEITENLKYKDLSAENKSTLEQVLMTADLVKFAKGHPDATINEDSMQSAVDFVLHSAQEHPANGENQLTRGATKDEHV